MSIEDAWTQAIRASARRLWNVDLEGVLLEPPSDPKFGDATCNAPMRLAKQLKKPPRAIAEGMRMRMKELGRREMGVEGIEDARWVLQDFGDIVLHIFHESQRELLFAVVWVREISTASQ